MKLIKLFCIVLILISTSLFAGVNLRNGNFYISYTDIIVPGGGQPLEITRTYNSKAAEKGWFGFGWGSPFETYLTISADSSIVVHENGSGADTRFIPKTSIDPKDATKRIIDAMRTKNKISKVAADKLTNRLQKDAELRRLYARNFKVTATIKTGTMLFSNNRGMQRLKKLKAGYKRTYGDGKTDFFNDKGNLTKTVLKNGHTVSLNYKGKELKSIKDSQAKQLFFEWYSDGKIKKVWSVGDKFATYKYDNMDLKQSIDIAGNKYIYEYDRNHNMNSIAYLDKTKMIMKYSKKTQFISSIADRSGGKVEYIYGHNKQKPDLHYWTIVKRKNLLGKVIKNRYEYELKIKPDGEQYTYRVLTIIDNSRTETVYNECCALPIKISRGKHVTTFKYDETNGQLLSKSSTKGESVKLGYDKKCNKINRVKNKKGWTNFKYDKKCNLAKAVNSKGDAVLLVYDRRGRITKMVDNNKKKKKKRVLSFKYNSIGKPVEIAIEKVGKIQVSYDNYGEIKKVNSKTGHKMALQVTRAFQNLLTIVKPAGVNLNL